MLDLQFDDTGGEMKSPSGMDLGALSWGVKPIQKKCALRAHNFSTTLKQASSCVKYLACIGGGGGGLSDKCTYMYAHLYILL